MYIFLDNVMKILFILFFLLVNLYFKLRKSINLFAPSSLDIFRVLRSQLVICFTENNETKAV